MSFDFKKIFSWKRTALLCLGVGLLAAGLLAFLQTKNNILLGFSVEISKGESIPFALNKIINSVSQFQNTEGYLLENQKLTAVAFSGTGVGSSFEIPGEPTRLLIPAIGVDAAIQSVGLTKKGDMGIPTNFKDVAWYNKGALPGMPGSAVIAGHLDGKNVPKAVFYDLQKLKLGDLVEVADQKGIILRFEVIDKQIYDYNASTTLIFSGDASKVRLNLITCAGSWIKSEKLYNKRIVVFTELIKSP